MAFLGSEKFDSLEDLYIQQLEDLYDAEKRLTRALSKMADAASASDLKQAFNEHLQQTEGHVHRLEQIFQSMGRDPERETCEAMKGLIDEGEDMINARGSDHVRDAALIAAAQRVEHYEMAGYGTVRNYAQRLGHSDAAQLLQQTLDEEGATDKKLTAIAERHINPEAQAD
ncbi:MAG: ferritin-like domain-containing protein [Phycisphaeraceae bacterium]